MWNLKNKVVVITGATNGIGKAALFEIAKHGPRLLLLIGIKDVQKIYYLS